MMKQVVKEGTGTAAALAGRRGRGQDRHGRAQQRAALNQPWFIGFTEPTWPWRSRSSASRAAPAASSRRRSPSRCSRRWGRGADAAASRATRSSTGATACSTGSARAAWPTSTAPRTRSSAGGSALKLLYRALRRGPGVRRALPPRGVARGRPAAPQRRPGLRPRRVGRHLLHRDGVPRGPHAQADRPRGGRRSTPTGAIDIVDPGPARGALRPQARRSSTATSSRTT